jgi:FAD/FMN-containing dehydrogenase
MFMSAQVSAGALANSILFLGKNNIFVPHGECQSVCIGGHVQTGGYGLLARSFGLLGDHVVKLEFIDHSGIERTITADDEDEFFSCMGGSPGNLGILTHVTIKVYRDSDYEGSRGLKRIIECTRENLEKVLKILAEMNDGVDCPRNYDLSIIVIGANFDIAGLIDPSKLPKEFLGRYYDENGHTLVPLIVIFAQWVPFHKNELPSEEWMKRLSENDPFQKFEVKPTSQLASQWMYRKTREYDLPYVKHVNCTTSTNLSTNGWVE